MQEVNASVYKAASAAVGGPAFPITAVSEYKNGVPSKTDIWTGLSVRDYFAAQALQGILASGNFLDPSGLFTGNGAPVMADAAFLLADAMLAAREQKEQGNDR